MIPPYEVSGKIEYWIYIGWDRISSLMLRFKRVSLSRWILSESSTSSVSFFGYLFCNILLLLREVGQRTPRDFENIFNSERGDLLPLYYLYILPRLLCVYQYFRGLLWYASLSPHITINSLYMNIIIKAQSYLTKSADMHLMWIMGLTIYWEMVAFVLFHFISYVLIYILYPLSHISWIS